MPMTDKPFALGRTAEVYAWEEGKILKLYYDWCPPGWVDREAAIARVVCEAGIASPAQGGIIEVRGRRGIVYERVDGVSMLDALGSAPLKAGNYAHQLAGLHHAMHAQPVDGLPNQRQSLIHAIEKAVSLSPALCRRILTVLEALPDDHRLCHGDFHPGNVILSADGPMVIDWMTASQGHPTADVARTRLLLMVGDPPSSGMMRLLFTLLRRAYLSSYLNAYRQKDPATVKLSQAFLPVLAAARLNENIAPEQPRLLAILRAAGFELP